MMEAVQCACGSLVGPPGEGGAGCMRGWRQPMGAGCMRGWRARGAEHAIPALSSC